MNITAPFSGRAPRLRNTLMALCLSGTVLPATAQQATNDVTTPLHLMKPDYPTPYGKPTEAGITEVLNRVLRYLEAATPAQVVDGKTKAPITDLKQLTPETIFAPGDFRLTSYEWGVTYAGALNAAAATGDKRFADYTHQRLQLIADVAPYFKKVLKQNPKATAPVRSVLMPHALDDAGAICAAMIKAQKEGNKANLRPLIDNFIGYISSKEFRLPDGTLARNRPQPNTLWLDDLFMSVPALAQMGSLTGDQKYFDDAVKQVLQFSQRMFNKEKGLYMHGWVQEMAFHPQFHWARANGWAAMTMVELLEVLPKTHAGYKPVLAQLQAHIQGLAAYQDGTGFWHQLIDRNDTYLETSATAIYAYAIARAINRGYVDKKAFAPVALLAWNAVATKVTDKGQVAGTCVGTGMGFDPAFYYYRPVNVFAAHGYGPVLLAGSEVLLLTKQFDFEINDSSLQLKTAAL
ncbi:Rhamnogalacturonyl hydrolase YesR [Cnuella takakiae]|uniref:Rhamnogalacturonyl hydrolase YesR n=1 Tax=Cnuella takakiae TaxID=1302690 RepID=A0A1M5GSU2_9BACT|nr:glycoside hydrolase family 88 protein [Cnuella takakiae]OLY90901.1 family 88 glycosyl hydrolase [Cnuella takakiae]SHG06789.1 Rhamnogalacturonyl hydrolase YesR [Cnuella takakiae]